MGTMESTAYVVKMTAKSSPNDGKPGKQENKQTSKV
jgi:hypothetical protein